jgi:hypothetical protein
MNLTVKGRYSCFGMCFARGIVFPLPWLAKDHAVTLSSRSMQLTCRTQGNMVDEDQPISFGVAAVARKRACSVKVSQRNSIGGVPMSSECVIMKSKRI